jgi:hypothetical protein
MGLLDLSLLRDAFLLLSRFSLIMLTLTCLGMLQALDVDRYDAIAELATDQLIWLAFYLSNLGLAALCREEG